MKPLFQVLGVLLALYVLYALASGRVYAKDRWWGRSFARDAEPGVYWSIIVIYTGLSLALYFVF
ncbi:MAG: hypothetical protein CMLOHMNK_02161 [Steroidobacteraceae bacterium]|nr:hypothetical protein [Steroidobacteraceae bacterium]